MKKVVFTFAALAVSTPAWSVPYFDANGPIRNGNQCWAVTDSVRGHGYWDECASQTEAAEFFKAHGVIDIIPVAKSQRDNGGDASAGGGGDSGGGSGGGGGGGGGGD